MRSLLEIDIDITETAARLNALHLERQEARRAELDAMCLMFDRGQSAASIARDMKMSKAAVIGALWRAGRTERGRAAKRRQLGVFLQGAPT
jgi:hypothetical protein